MRDRPTHALAVAKAVYAVYHDAVSAHLLSLEVAHPLLHKSDLLLILASSAHKFTRQGLRVTPGYHRFFRGVRVVARGLRLPFYARAFLPWRAPRVQLVARSEGASSLSVDGLSHVARSPSVRDVRGLLAMEAVEVDAVPEARDTYHAACTERVAPRGEASAID